MRVPDAEPIYSYSSSSTIVTVAVPETVVFVDTVPSTVTSSSSVTCLQPTPKNNVAKATIHQKVFLIKDLLKEKMIRHIV